MKMRRRKSRHDRLFLGRWLNHVCTKSYVDVDELIAALLKEPT